jgi:hypothetical protein
MDWQAFIKQLRYHDDGSKKMSLSDIAEAVGTPLSTVSSIAAGDTTEPRAGLAMRLIERFGQSADKDA